jgi:hypothetical protein
MGVMGAGIALEFRVRYPEMYICYVELCQQNFIDIGKLWLYKSEQRWVLNFPTKKDWRRPSQTTFLEFGLQKFVDTYLKKEITSIAFPLLGAQNGGIPEHKSLKIMEKYLSQCTLPIEIYIYDPNSPDDIFAELKRTFFSLPKQDIIDLTGLREANFDKVKKVMLDDDICSLSNFLSADGVGISTVEKTLLILRNN